MPAPSGPGEDDPRGFDKRIGNDQWWTRTDLRELLSTVEAATRRHYPWLSPQEAEEAATEAIMRVIRAADEGRVTLKNDPTGYLVVVARNVVVDNLRSGHLRRELPLSAQGWLESSRAPERSDDEIAAFIERDAASDDIRRGLAVARKGGDTTAFRVVTFTLDEIGRTGQMPSSREIGDRLGLSHTGVSKALKRFRSYLAGRD